MEGVTIGNIAGAVTLVVANVIGLKWLRSDLKKVEQTMKVHDTDLRKLYNGLDETMTKKEISEFITQIVEPIKESLSETKVTMNVMNKNVVNMTVTIARMDERMKVRRG